MKTRLIVIAVNICFLNGPFPDPFIYSRLFNTVNSPKMLPNDAVNQVIWSLSIESRLEGFVIVAKCKQYAQVLT